MKSQHHIHLWFSGILLIFLMFITSCSRNNKESDAYGNFESDEVIVSAQSQGILLSLDVLEGDIVKKDQVIGKIDTTVPLIKQEELMAQHSVINARLHNLEAQLNVQEEQRINLVREVNRTEKLFQEKAATQQQYDEILGQLKVLDSQTEAVRSQKNIILGEETVLKAQLDEVRDLLKKCRITSPLTGTVLEKYCQTGELVTPGKALLKVANISEMELKVYIGGSQLSSVALGDSVDVIIDGTDKTLQRLKGTVSWISSQVEFTPKIIQTRDERVNMVYAVKIRAINDGRLKIGMPGEVVFSEK